MVDAWWTHADARRPPGDTSRTHAGSTRTHGQCMRTHARTHDDAGTHIEERAWTHIFGGDARTHVRRRMYNPGGEYF